jgi:hypothetical protein
VILEKHCIDQACKAHPMFGIAVKKDAIVWACSVHRALLPDPVFHMKPDTPPALLTQPEPPKQGSLF